VRGGRFVDVRLTGYRQSVRLRFAVLLPTEGFDYEKSPLRELYARVQDFPDLTVDEMRQRLREMPCCTTNAEARPTATRSTSCWSAPLRSAGGAEQQRLDVHQAITVDSVRRMVGRRNC